MRMEEKYEILSSSIYAVILLILFEENIFESSTMNLFTQLIQSFPPFYQFQELISSFQIRFRSFQLDQKEFSLLLFMLITRTSSSFSSLDLLNFLHFIDLYLQPWSDLQLQSVQIFCKYLQSHLILSLSVRWIDFCSLRLVRRSNVTQEIPVDFYEISLFVTQLRSFNRRFSHCLLHLPFPSISNLPEFFYRIYC